MLADALPDDFGNALIDAWMAQQGVNKSQITSLDRLAYMAKRGIGALEFRPARGPGRSKSTTAIKLSALVESARRAMQGEIDTDEHAKAALAQIIQVGTSAGGARAKAVISWNPKTHEIRAGQFDVELGFEHWLIKFDGVGIDERLGVSQDYGRIEYAYYLMAKAAGIEMSESRLLEENDRAHFMTKRFDRDGNKKHHLQTLCGLAHLDYRQKATHDASQLFLTINRLGIGYSGMEQAFRRAVNPNVKNPLGYPVGYEIMPGDNVMPLLLAEDYPQKRAGFTDFQLWVTKYNEDERYAGGLYPMQSQGGDGLPAWTKANRSIENTDIVVWYTMGLHHVPHAEDWPVMPVMWIGFELRPYNFFAHNAALDLPE